MKKHHRVKGKKGPKKPFLKKILPILGGILGAPAGTAGISLGVNIGRGLASGKGFGSITDAFKKQDVFGIVGDKIDKVEGLVSGKDGQRDQAINNLKKEASQAAQNSLINSVRGKRSMRHVGNKRIR